MRKNDLIKLLSEIKGNPEIVAWNGYAGDWMHFSSNITKMELSKYSWEGMKETCRLEECINTKNFNFQFSPEEEKELRKSYMKYQDWEYCEGDPRSAKWLKFKTVYVLQAKPRGVSTYDRIGNISY